MAVIDGTQHVAVNQIYADLYGYFQPDDLSGEPWNHRVAEADRTRLDIEPG